jgi:hypothetical protein
MDALQTVLLPLRKSIILYTQREHLGLAEHREHHPMFVSVRSPQALRLSSLTPPSTPFHHPTSSRSTPFSLRSDFTKLHFPEWDPHSSVGKPGSLHYPTGADWRATPCPNLGRWRGGGAWTAVSIPYRGAQDVAWLSGKSDVHRT